MSMHDSDGIDEALQGVTHLALSTAARVGEQMARRLAQESRDAQARSEQAARESAARLEAEREAARAALAPVHHDRWWDTATAEDVTKAYTTATAWRDLDPLADRAAERIVKQARTRHGIDLREQSSISDPSQIPVALDRVEQEAAEAREQWTKAGGERAEAAGLLAGADALDAYAEMEHQAQNLEGNGAGLPAHHEGSAAVSADERRDQADHAYDSAERREAMARRLDHVENQGAVDARVRSDVAQGRPATDAVSSAPGRAPKARKAKVSPHAARTTQHTGQSR